MTGGEIDIMPVQSDGNIGLEAADPIGFVTIGTVLDKVLICWFNCTWEVTLTEILLAPPVSATVRIVTSDLGSRRRLERPPGSLALIPASVARQPPLCSVAGG